MSNLPFILKAWTVETLLEGRPVRVESFVAESAAKASMLAKELVEDTGTGLWEFRVRGCHELSAKLDSCEH